MRTYKHAYIQTFIHTNMHTCKHKRESYTRRASGGPHRGSSWRGTGRAGGAGGLRGAAGRDDGIAGQGLAADAGTESYSRLQMYYIHIA